METMFWFVLCWQAIGFAYLAWRLALDASGMRAVDRPELTHQQLVKVWALRCFQHGTVVVLLLELRRYV